MVLISFRMTRPFSMKKSTRAMPAQSTARKAAMAISRTRFVSRAPIGAGTLTVASPSVYFVA